MARRISAVLSVIWAHPIASCFVLLFFTPPLFPVVVYFSPLLISTALCVLALISVGPHVAATGDEAETQSKRLKVDSLNIGPWEAGLSSMRERAKRKFRMSMEEMTWAEWMKGQDGWGRSPGEKQLREQDPSTDSANRENDSALIDDTGSPVEIAEIFGTGIETCGDKSTNVVGSLSSISERSEDLSKADNGVIGEQDCRQADGSCSSLEEDGSRKEQGDQRSSRRKEQRLEEFGSERTTNNLVLLDAGSKEISGSSKLQPNKQVEEGARRSSDAAVAMRLEGMEAVEANVKESRADEEEEMGGAGVMNV